MNAILSKDRRLGQTKRKVTQRKIPDGRCLTARSSKIDISGYSSNDNATLGSLGILGLFTASQPELTRSEISGSLSAEGFIVSEDRLDRKLAALEANGKLVKLPATSTGNATYLKASAAKKKENALNTLEAVFGLIRKRGDAGANVIEIREAMTGKCGSGTIEKHLSHFCDAGQIRLEQNQKRKTLLRRFRHG